MPTLPFILKNVNFATFILSTGRCGTQWIASSLAAAYADVIEVEHEPLHDRYDARAILAHNDLSNASDALSPKVREHLDNIESQLATRTYLECGHPCWSTIPHLLDRFRDRVRVIHLVRHPVPTCCSWLTHGAFQPPILPHMPEKTLLSPFDEGIQFKEYQQTWGHLQPFEKCLFYWAEVNALGLRLQKQSDVPWLRLRYEDLFQGNGLQNLLAFLNLPPRTNVLQRKNETVDEFKYLSPVWQDCRIIEKHPAVVAVAQQLGYDINDVDDNALRTRYLAQFPI